MIQAVFFDIDDTLYHFSAANRIALQKVEQYVQKQLGLELKIWKDAVTQAQDRISARLGKSSVVCHNRQIRFQNAMEIIGLPIYPHASQMYKIYWDTVLELAVVEPGVENLIRLLKKKKIYIGAGSDMTSYIQNKKLEQLKLAPYFDGVITSEEAGGDKPDPQIYRLCAQKAGCSMEQCLFIGDNWEKDVVGPRAAGMHAAWYQKYAKSTVETERCYITSYEDCIHNGEEIRIGELRI